LLAKLSGLALQNAQALEAAIRFCAAEGIGAFRINSQVLPLKTHPQHGYRVDELAAAETIERQFRTCGELARELDIRLSFHPDQFVVLNSTRPEVVAASLAELEYQAEVAEWVGADVINIHAGGAFGDKLRALAALADAADRLSARARERLTLENDDRIYTPSDLLPLCGKAGIPLVYDVHHHRCHGDELPEGEATDAAAATWAGREPLFHISSPLEGWKGPRPERHHDWIDLADFPRVWRDRALTVDVEAKAKEAAVLKLRSDLERDPSSRRLKVK
jgi:UV DNA damage endonuclease